MSSLQIAEITGKPHRNVTGDIARILGEAEIDEQEFLHIFKDAYGRDQKGYHLPRRECNLDGLPTRWFSLHAGVSASVRILNPEATNPGAEHHQI